MFRQPTLDPTAGERARQIREFPDQPQVILDPTDPRCGAVDPTDPRYGAVYPIDPRYGAAEPAVRRYGGLDPTDPRYGPDAA